MSAEPSAQEYRQGVRRLRSLLPAARASVRRGGHNIAEPSAILEAQAPWLREDNFAALVVYPAPLGGWLADLTLKHVPPGISNAVGTPIGSPCTSREQAEVVAFSLLCCALQVEAETKAAGKPASGDRAFQLYGVSIRLPAAIYNIALDQFPEGETGYGSEEAAVERIETVLGDLFKGEPVTAATLRALPRDRYAELAAVCVGATLSGLHRYPAVQHRPPSAGPFVVTPERGP